MDTSPTAGSRPCPACGTSIAADSRFCYKCGAIMPGGGPAPAPAKAGMSTGVKVLLAVVAVAVFMFILLVVTAVLAAPSLMRHSGAARVVHARVEIQMFKTALATYKLDTGEYPTTDQGLAALRQQPGGVKNWSGPYIVQDVPKDPWGHDFVYRYPGEHGDEPDIISYGADGQPGGEGVNADIVSWKSQ